MLQLLTRPLSTSHSPKLTKPALFVPPQSVLPLNSTSKQISYRSRKLFPLFHHQIRQETGSGSPPAALPCAVASSARPYLAARLQVAVPLESSAPPRISRAVRSALPKLGLSLAAGSSETATVLRFARAPEPPLSASPGFWVQAQLRAPPGGSRARGSRLQETWPAVALPGPSALRPRAAAAARHMPPPGSSGGTCRGDRTGAPLVRLRVLRAPAHPSPL